MLKKLAIITTHPIQYNAPFFKLLNNSKIVQPKVFYTWGETVLEKKYDPGFDKTIEWDIPLLEGYDYEFLFNSAKQKGSHHFNGIINPAILKKLNQYQPDAILVYGWKFNSHMKVMRHYRNRIPVWFRGDSTLLDDKKDLKNLLRTLLLRWVYKHVDIAFYTGANNKNYFLQYGLKQHQLIKAAHAIDNDRFQNTDNKYSTAASQWKGQLNIEPGAFVFLFAGKLEKKKGVENLICAFESYTNKNVHLLIVGNGIQEKDLKTNYSKIRNLHFIDFQNQELMPVVYQLCDAFVLPSAGPGETWGLSINEAMAAGKAILASDKCGGAVDLIDDGGNGYIFRAGDMKDLISKMQKLTEAKENLKIMQAHSLKKSREFTFGSFIEAIENSFQKKNG